MDNQCGSVVLTLAQAMRERGLDADRLAGAARIQRSQLNLYLNNDIKRPDLNVLARICAVLGCGIESVMRYVPQNSKTPADAGNTALRTNRQNTYTTGMLAGDVSVHSNTVRFYEKSEERRVGKECRSRWSPYH